VAGHKVRAGGAVYAATKHAVRFAPFPGSHVWDAHSLHVLSFENGEISAVTLFLEPRLFEAFGLAPTLEEPPPASDHPDPFLYAIVGGTGGGPPGSRHCVLTI